MPTTFIQVISVYQPIATKDWDLIRDRNGILIRDNDRVSLAWNITADDSFWILPNWWSFDKEDIYRVFFDHRISAWSLDMWDDVQPDTPYNRKYINHAIDVLHSGNVTIV